MTPFIADPDFTLHVGDVRDVLRELPADSVDCALTSPPFYALRDYGVDGQIGLEATPELWATELVGVFREVRRVLKPAGTLWVECGDSYAGSWGAQSREGDSGLDSLSANQIAAHPKTTRTGARGLGHGVKAKDLFGTPWLLAFALRADGWWLRQAIIWHKPNAMPESATDRCTTAHSYVFLLSKQARYWFDAEAIAEPAEWARWGDQTVPKYEGTETASGWMQSKTKAELVARGGRTTNGQRERTADMRGFDNRLERADGKKNARSVWTIPTQGYPEAHFATWPEALCERIIKAGCPEWVCVKCGKARERLTKKETRPTQRVHNGVYDASSGRGKSGWLPSVQSSETLGWSDCGCGAGFTPGVCIDPFMGSGTTALVARRLGRRSIGVELNEAYAHLAARRLGQQSLLAGEAA